MVGVVKRRSSGYRVVLNGPSPKDLTERCTAAWVDLLDLVQRVRCHGLDGDRARAVDRPRFPSGDGNADVIPRIGGPSE